MIVMHRIRKIFCVLSIGIIALYGALFFLSRNYVVNKWQAVFVFVYFALLQCVVVHWCLGRADSKLRKVVMVCSSLLSLGMACLFQNSMLIEFPQGETTLYITATAEKNADAQSKEVWIKQITVDGTNVDLSAVWQDEVWKYNAASNTLLANPQDEASTIELNFQNARNVSIDFIKHEWSGIVKVGDSLQHQETFDLYSAEGEEISYQLNIPLYTNMAYRLLSFAASWLIFGEVLWGAFRILTNKFDRKNMNM